MADFCSSCLLFGPNSGALGHSLRLWGASSLASSALTLPLPPDAASERRFRAGNMCALGLLHRVPQRIQSPFLAMRD